LPVRPQGCPIDDEHERRNLLRRVKALVKQVVSPVVDATGWYDRRVRRAVAHAGSWTIVMYHRVIDNPSADPFGLGMCVHRDHFEQQVRYFARHFNLLTVGDACQRLSAGQALPRRALSITFDDGYLDNLTCAWPILQRHEVPFSIYVPTGGVDEGQCLWWDRVIAAMAGTSRSGLDLQEVGLSAERLTVTWAGLDGHEVVQDVLARLWALPRAECERAVDRLVAWLGPVDLLAQGAQRLDRHQLRQLHRAGVEIGAHSVSHPNLSLLGLDELRDELVRSRDVLQAWLDAPVRGFAHPGGWQHAQARDVLAEQGYAYALTTESGLNLAPPDPMNLRRVGMPDAPLADFRRAFGGALVRATPADGVRF
jgi:peptidoglycan/xylan/chitin deacetylase (PgdA/CDA1 family)